MLNVSIDPLGAVPPTGAPPAPAFTGSPPGAPAFGPTLLALLGDAGPSLPPAAARPVVAVPGKNVPGDDAGLFATDDTVAVSEDGDPVAEPVLAWLMPPPPPPPGGLAPALPAPAPRLTPGSSPPVDVVALPDAVPEPALPAAPKPADLVAGLRPPVLMAGTTPDAPLSAPAKPGEPASLLRPTVPAVAATTAEAPAADPPVAPLPVLREAPPAPLSAVRPEQTIQALRPAILPPADRDEPAPLIAAATPAVASAGAPAVPVQAAGNAQQAGIDLTRDPGLHRMIDRIEALRDAANANDTRIRLIPDALGPVEVSVRREGDAVQVRFSAQQEATRQLIADATPRLTELAEARGVRIERASVDAGMAQGWGEPSRQPAWAQPDPNSRPTPAAVSADADAIDHRIA